MDSSHYKTKLLIAETAVRQMLSVGYDKVRVLDIAREAGLNKNSFYYHFSSREEVVRWLLRYDIARMLTEAFEEEYLVPVGPGAGLYPNLPYYVRIPLGARMIDQGAFMRSVVAALRTRQAFYTEVFLHENTFSLIAYMEKLYRPLFAQDVEHIAAGRYLPEKTKAFLVEYFLKAFMGMVKHMVTIPELSDGLMDEDLNPFWNMGMESLSQAIRAHPFNVSILDQITSLP